MNYRAFAKEQVVWGLGALLVPALIGWAMALFTVVNDMSSTGNQIARACSIPIALQIGLAIDGEWAPLLVSILGTLLVAGGLIVIWIPGARSKIIEVASTGKGYASAILSKEDANEGGGTKTALTKPESGTTTTKSRTLKIIGLFGGGFLTIFGAFIVWFAWQHRPVEDSFAGATDALFNRGLGIDGWVFQEGPFVFLMGLGVVAITIGLLGVASALIAIIWKRI